MFFAYILRSEDDQGFYFGHCSNINKRLQMHNNGRVKSTKARIPFHVHYLESYPSKSEAYKREQFFKSFEGRIWLKTNKII
jgi:putative endonuclease